MMCRTNDMQNKWVVEQMIVEQMIVGQMIVGQMIVDKWHSAGKRLPLLLFPCRATSPTAPAPWNIPCWHTSTVNQVGGLNPCSNDLTEESVKVKYSKLSIDNCPTSPNIYLSIQERYISQILSQTDAVFFLSQVVFDFSLEYFIVYVLWETARSSFFVFFRYDIVHLHNDLS